MSTIQSVVNIGVDIGKFDLDFHCHESDEHFSVSNTTDGIRQAFKQLAKYTIEGMVVSE